MDQQKQITILVVEDQANLRDTLARALGEDGYAVITAATGKEAFDILWRDKERIDWLFTDVRLPGDIDGWRVAEEFRFAHPFRPVVYATTEGVDGARMVPGSIFFQKPYRPSEIVAAFKGLSDSHPDGIDMNGVDLVMPPRATHQVPLRNLGPAGRVSSMPDANFTSDRRSETVR